MHGLFSTARCNLLTFATIAAGAPSDAAAITRHFLTQTLPQDLLDLARYYTRGGQGGAEEREFERLAIQVADGEVLFSEALAELMLWHLRAGGAGDLEDEDRISDRLADAVDRIRGGGAKTDAAELRRDMHPLVARGLGVNPDSMLTIAELNALLAGRRADGGKIEGKHYSVLRTYTDPRTGHEKEKIPLGSVDFCFTPDKSVSLAWAFATPAEQASIYQAHRDAAHEAMLHLEQEIGRAAKGEGGRGGHDPGHIAWVAFDHYTARPTLALPTGSDRTEAIPVPVAGDPDLHTHFTVMNAVFCENGRVGSLDLGRLNGLIKETGALYQAHLAQRLRDIGADVALDPTTGMARLPAIPDHLRTHFSKRSKGGEEAAREYARMHGLEWDELPAERRLALLKSGTQHRRAVRDDDIGRRVSRDDMADFSDWQRQAADLGWRHTTILAHGPPAPPISPEERLAHAREEALPWLEKDLHRSAVLTGADIRTAALRGLIAAGIEATSDINRVTNLFMRDGVRQDGHTTGLLWEDRGEDSRCERATTLLHADQEQEFLRLAGTAGADLDGALPHRQLKAAIAASDLNFTGEHGRAQRGAIYRIGQGGRLTVLIGAAGAGKTTLLGPLVAAWQADGRDVHGIALAWRQADELTDAGIASGRVKAFTVFQQAAAASEFALGRTSVVVVDEVSLLGTRQGLELLRLQAEHGFRVVLLGDDRQCRAVEAGEIIDLTRRALGEKAIPQILTTVRQHSAREREIAGLFRDGAAAKALAMKREDGTAILTPGGFREAVERTAALVEERLRANRKEKGYSLTVSAPTNMDALRLGEAIRQRRRAIGDIGADQVRLQATDRDGNEYAMALAPGDRVRLFASVTPKGERGSIGRNGTVLTVLHADAQGMRVRNAKGRDAFVHWTSLADARGRVRLSYGEVLTTHSAQGLTSTEHILALAGGSKSADAHTAYVSGSRHRHASYLVLSAGAEQAEIKRRRPLNDLRPIGADEVWENVARNLSAQPKKDLATDFLAQAVGLRQSAARSLQRGLRPAELNERVGRSRTRLAETLRHRRQVAAIAPAVERLGRTIERQQMVVQRLAGIAPAVARAVRSAVDRVRSRQRGPARDQGVAGPRPSV